MQFKTKWSLRQISFELIMYVLCCTTALVLAPIAIRAWDFYEHGFGMYPGIKVPNNINLQQCLDVFWQMSVLPALKWLPFTVVGDIAMRRWIFGLNR